MMRYFTKNRKIKSSPLEENRDISHLHFEENSILSNETLLGIEQLGAVLRSIHARLVQEGYSIIEGKLYNPQGELLYERKNTTKSQ